MELDEDAASDVFDLIHVEVQLFKSGQVLEDTERQVGDRVACEREFRQIDHAQGGSNVGPSAIRTSESKALASPLFFHLIRQLDVKAGNLEFLKT